MPGRVSWRWRLQPARQHRDQRDEGDDEAQRVAHPGGPPHLEAPVTRAGPGLRGRWWRSAGAASRGARRRRGSCRTGPIRRTRRARWERRRGSDPGEGVAGGVVDGDDRRRRSCRSEEPADDGAPADVGAPGGGGLPQLALPVAVEPVSAGDVDDRGGDPRLLEEGGGGEELGHDGPARHEAHRVPSPASSLPPAPPPGSPSLPPPLPPAGRSRYVPASTPACTACSPSRATAASNGAWSMGRAASRRYSESPSGAASRLRPSQSSQSSTGAQPPARRGCGCRGRSPAATAPRRRRRRPPPSPPGPHRQATGSAPRREPRRPSPGTPRCSSRPAGSEAPRHPLPRTAPRSAAPTSPPSRASRTRRTAARGGAPSAPGSPGPGSGG